MRMLAAGRWVGPVLDHCTGCMSCDACCPNGAGPYGLLLERYQYRYIRSGIPRIFCNAMPGREGPNLWRALDKWLTGQEKRDLREWSKPPDREEVLFLGCNQRLTPYIAHAGILGGLRVFTAPDECCGEYYLRLGLMEEARRKALSLARRFEHLGIRKVIAFCPACQNTMQNLAPRALGVMFNVEVQGLVEWLAGEAAAGRLVPSGNSGGTVTVQDPCHASGLGEEPVRSVRHLLESIGLTPVEMANSGTKAECCGLGASLARYRISDVARTAFRRANLARGTHADRTCVWCNGCYMVMNMSRLSLPWIPPVFHLVELLELATGGVPVRRMPARALELAAAAVEASARDRFRFGRVSV